MPNPLLMSADPHRTAVFTERLAFTYYDEPVPGPEELNRANSNCYFFSIDNQLVYQSFYQDSGPLNAACLYRFCLHLHGLLNDPALTSHRIVLYSSADPAKKANAAMLISLYALVVWRWSVPECVHPLCAFELMPFRDAGYAPADFNLSLQSVLYGIFRAMTLRLLDFSQFDVDEYERSERVEFGDWNWIMRLAPEVAPEAGIIAFASPLEARPASRVPRSAAPAATTLTGSIEDDLRRGTLSGSIADDLSFGGTFENGASSPTDSTSDADSQSDSLSPGSPTRPSLTAGTPPSQPNLSLRPVEETPPSVSSSSSLPSAASPPSPTSLRSADIDPLFAKAPINTPFKHLLTSFRRHNVKRVIRLNKKLYDARHFTDHGMAHTEMYFDDGTSPTLEMTRAFIDAAKRTIDNERGTLAVHCKAGLGRTGTLIGAYLIYRYHFRADEAIGFMRILRPGSCVGPQQHYLKEYEHTWAQWAAVDAFKLKGLIVEGGRNDMATALSLGPDAEQNGVARKEEGGVKDSKRRNHARSGSEAASRSSSGHPQPSLDASTENSTQPGPDSSVPSASLGSAPSSFQAADLDNKDAADLDRPLTPPNERTMADIKTPLRDLQNMPKTTPCPRSIPGQPRKTPGRHRSPTHEAVGHTISSPEVLSDDEAIGEPLGTNTYVSRESYEGVNGNGRAGEREIGDVPEHRTRLSSTHSPAPTNGGSPVKRARLSGVLAGESEERGSSGKRDTSADLSHSATLDASVELGRSGHVNHASKVSAKTAPKFTPKMRSPESLSIDELLARDGEQLIDSEGVVLDESMMLAAVVTPSTPPDEDELSPPRRPRRKPPISQIPRPARAGTRVGQKVAPKAGRAVAAGKAAAAARNTQRAIDSSPSPPPSPPLDARRTTRSRLRAPERRTRRA